MAKTTRKTESIAGEKKPAARRAKAAPAAGAVKPAARRTAKAAPEAAPAQGANVPEPTHDEIALRAWSIYERRGGSHGDANRDWLQAVEELLRERGLKP